MDSNDLLSGFNRFFKKFFNLPAEMQVVVGLLMSLVIAIMMKWMLNNQGLPSLIEYWVLLAIFVCGLMIGPAVGFVVAVGFGLAYSPLGPFTETAGEPVAWMTRLLALVVFGLLGGTLQRLLLWLNIAKDKAENSVERTGLPNINAALTFLKEVSEQSGDDDEVDILNVKLNNIDAIRQQVGQGKADELLVLLADKLKSTLGKNSHVSLVAGGELLGIQPNQTKPVQSVQEEIAKILDEPLQLGADVFHLNTSTGMHRTQPSRYQLEPQQLLDEVTSSAISAAAGNQKILYKGIDPINTSKLEELTSSRQIINSIKNSEIKLYYQPRLNTNRGFFDCLEATVCWEHPRRGLLWLNDFKPMLEGDAMMQYFTLWTVRESLLDIAKWRSKKYKFRVSINITLDDVLYTRVLTYILAQVQRQPKLAAVFTIELTERALLRSDVNIRQYLKHIQQAGVFVVVTNFAGDNATIQALFRMPVDAVKLAGTIIKKAIHHSDQKRELAILIKMIRSRGLSVIADGVADRPSLVMLRELGCEELQGPILSRALEKSAIPWDRVR